MPLKLTGSVKVFGELPVGAPLKISAMLSFSYI